MIFDVYLKKREKITTEVFATSGENTSKQKKVFLVNLLEMLNEKEIKNLMAELIKVIFKSWR